MPPAEIPALSMWKMFNETILALLRTESTESGVKRLANVIKKQDISDIFLYNRDQTITVEEYEQVADKYQAFGTWVLGRFFHLLSCEKLISSHEAIIDIQMHILRLLANTRSCFYHQMTKEYCKVLHDLVDYSKKGNVSITLKVFIPEKYDDLNDEDLDLSPIAIEVNRRNFPYFTQNVVKFFRMILTDKIEYCSYNSQDLSQNLKDLIYLLSEAHLEVKFEILAIYLEILKKDQHRSEIGSIIQSRLDTMESYFGGILSDIHSLDEDEIKKFQPLLTNYVQLAENKSKLAPVLKMLIDPKDGSTAALMSDDLIKAITAALESDLPISCDFPTFGNTAATIVLCLQTRKEIAAFCQKTEAPQDGVIKVHDPEVSHDWSRFCSDLYGKIECGSQCGLALFFKFFHKIAEVLIGTKMKLRNSNLIFFQEDRLLLSVLTQLNQHNCVNEIPIDDIVTFITDLPTVCNTDNLMLYLDLVTSQIFGLSDMKREFVGDNQRQIKQEMMRLNLELLKSDWDKSEALRHFRKIVWFISCGFFDTTASQLEEIERTYLKLSQSGSSTGDSYQRQIVAMLPHVFSFATDPDILVAKILIPNCDNPEVGSVLPKIACMSTSDFFKVIDSSLIPQIFCVECHLREKSKDLVASEVSKSALAIDFTRITVDITTVTGVTLKCVAKLLASKSQQMRKQAVDALPSCSKHIRNFHSGNFTKLWIDKCGDDDIEVRRKLAQVLPEMFENLNDSEIDPLLTSLQTYTKLSLRNSDFDLQLTLLRTIEHLCGVKSDKVLLTLLKLVAYFIMVPTSKYYLIAINVMAKIAERRDVTLSSLYRKFRDEMSETIVHLCIVNQGLNDSGLATSLAKISIALDYSDVKDFIGRECQHLLPYFVSKITKHPKVGGLIEEMALLIDIDLAEMLAAKYGTIFLHIFLNETKDDFKKCMTYLEQTTGQTGPVLRKRNFRVILNDLLLNFHTHRDKVILALKLLSQEDSDGSPDVPTYLQSRFLGLLQYFDLKLMSHSSAERKNSVLLSLSDLFRYMGSKHISPLRYKIIATLRTDGYSSSCEVWDAFVRSCDVEALAPQLATIFVSLLPLLDVNQVKINDIFRYLLLESENVTKSFIGDLFFVENDLRLDREVGNVIKRHLSKGSEPLRAKIKQFLRHLSHETVEVRIYSLRHLKSLLEENREEVDRMILGYNGIDPVFVDLIEILASGCREKNETFKLACGDVIGELGAIEPSHLPRKCAENCKTFTFFMEDDVFIINALGELSKAFQGEKNTHNVDRFGLAIQEILRNHSVSPHAGSSRNHLWTSLPEAQQELMLPFLTSRYITNKSMDSDNYPCPIFGTTSAASFQTWLHSWTCSLISTLPADSRSLLNACLPAMRQERRILMTFLPHIVLHSLAGGTNDDKSYSEMTAVISYFDVKQPISDIGPFPAGKPKTPEETANAETGQCTKVAFVIFDFLERWVREWQWQKGKTGGHDKSYEKIKGFLRRFCKLQLAKCNYRCAEYPRALMYLEDYVTENAEEKPNQLTFLTEIYAHLDEPDGVAGVTALRQTEPSIEDRILPLKMSGKLTDAAACYERMAQPLNPNHMRGLFQCYLDLDSVNTALNLAKGASSFDPFLFEAQAEPLWRLGRYEELESFINTPGIDSNGRNNWGIQIGKALLAFESDSSVFKTVIDELKLRQIEYLGATTLEEGSYQNGYEYIAQLHSLNEIEQVARVTKEILIKPNDGDFISNQLARLRKEWELRLKIVQESTKIVEPLLRLRRVSLEQTKRICRNKAPQALGDLDRLLGECWLLSARLARKCGNHQQAYSYALKAEEYSPPRLFLEKAKLFWMREEHEQALATLQRGVEFLSPVGTNLGQNSLLSLNDRKLCAEAKLLIAVYNDETSNVDTEINITHYKEALETYKEWEKPLVLLAQFFDRIFNNLSESERDDEKGSMRQLHMINYFGKSLMYGTCHVYQSMPRLLSIWFDYGTRLFNVVQTNNSKASTKEFRKEVLLKMTKLIDNTLENLPAYVFLTAFSQLVSRISHPQKEVYIELKSIIIKLLLQYPQHTLWMIISVIKSGYSVRAKRCAEILGDSRLKSSPITGLVNDFTMLAEKLIELCNKEIGPDVKTTTVSALLRALPKLLRREDFSEIMIPTFKFRKLVLPNPDFSTLQHNPFPNHYVHIVGIEEEVTVLYSLQRPRKITFRGSDGKGYVQMLKPKDDLRKDFRLMEFNDIVNQLLVREAEARQRRLNIRLYSVAPLNEECGLVEWIPNLLGLRPIVLSIYKQKGLGLTNKELKAMYCNIRDPLEKKRDVFTKSLLPNHPPVLGEWFRRTFPDAQSWLIARTAYIRTTAVMSMVGYVLGLGDRHGENINFDATCGDVVHVDFNCLFNKGETLEWPERVPFRLTPNMVAAMGPLGVEGMFRKSCACTLRVLRTNSTTLMSIVTPFVYDPLVSWPRNVPGTSQGSSNAERTNELARDHIKNIELRLQGIVKTKTRSLSIPLSVEGQTNNLIKEATSVDNLCQMFVGWGAYL